MSAAAQVLRRVVGVALFDRDACREILYDPRAIYQALVVLAITIAASIALEVVIPVEVEVNVTLTPDEELELQNASIGLTLWRVLAGEGMWVAGLVAIMVAGRWVMRADTAPSWRGFTSLWIFAGAPWMLVSLLSIGFWLINYGDGSGRAGGLVSLIVFLGVLIAGILWGIAVQVHAVRHAFDAASTSRATVLVIAVWVLQSAIGYVL